MDAAVVAIFTVAHVSRDGTGTGGAWGGGEPQSAIAAPSRGGRSGTRTSPRAARTTAASPANEGTGLARTPASRLRASKGPVRRWRWGEREGGRLGLAFRTPSAHPSHPHELTSARTPISPSSSHTSATSATSARAPPRAVRGGGGRGGTASTARRGGGPKAASRAAPGTVTGQSTRAARCRVGGSVGGGRGGEGDSATGSASRLATAADAVAPAARPSATTGPGRGGRA